MDTVEAVAFSPDGKQILSASRDKTLRLWNAAGQPITVLRGHTDAVQSAAWLPDGQRAVSAGADASVKVWDLETGNCLRTLPCDAPSRFVTVSPDGTAVAASNDRGWIHIWDPNDGIPRQRFFGRAQGGWCLAFSPDGARLALAGDDLLVHVWEAATGRWLKSLDADGMMRCVAFSPDGKSIAAGGWRRALRIWDAKSYGLVRSLGDHLDEVRGLAFSRDGQRLATASFDGTIKIWALEPKGAGGEAWGQPVNGLRCSLALTPTALRVGHPYVLDVSVENVSDTATHLHFPTVCQAERLTIRNQHGDEVKRRPMRLYGPMPPQAFFHLIKPGERFTAQIKGRVACQSVPAADQPAAGAYRALLLDSQDVAHEIGRPGEFTAHVRFAADDKTVAQGKRSGIEPVWTGTMDSNSVAFSVRPMTSEELEVVIRAVGNGTEKEQLEAVDVLRAIADRRAVPALMGVLAKGPGPLQQAAAAALGSIHDTSAVPDLLALYKRFAGRTDPVSGEFARCVLDAWSALEPDEQKKAALCVEVLGSDAAVEARSSMAWRLVRLKHPQRIPALLAAARDNDPRMQWAAIDVLGSVARETPGEAEPQIAAALIDLLKNAPDQTVRSRAAGALGNVADKAVVPALVAALKDPNHFVGASAAHSLGGLAGPEAIPALEEFAKGAEQKGQADAAKQAIERIKQRHP